MERVRRPLWRIAPKRVVDGLLAEFIFRPCEMGHEAAFLGKSGGVLARSFRILGAACRWTAVTSSDRGLRAPSVRHIGI